MKDTGKTRITSLLLALLMLVSVLSQTAVPVFAQQEGAESEIMTGETAVSQVLLQSESEEQKPLAGKTIACVGDSITAAYGVTKDETDYVTLLAQQLGMDYILLFANADTIYALPSSSQNGHGSIQPFPAKRQVGSSHFPHGFLVFTT